MKRLFKNTVRVLSFVFILLASSTALAQIHDPDGCPDLRGTYASKSGERFTIQRSSSGEVVLVDDLGPIVAGEPAIKVQGIARLAFCQANKLHYTQLIDGHLLEYRMVPSGSGFLLIEKGFQYPWGVQFQKVD